MNQFFPFRGVRYNSATEKLGLVVAPPYDVISESQREEYYQKDSHNVIRLELNGDADPYEAARECYDSWKKEAVLITDPQPTFYVYYQTFRTPNGEQVTRRGVIGRLRVTPYPEKNVLPHEQTLFAPKKDRFALLDAVKTNISPIFGLIDEEAQIFDHTIDSVTAMAPIADIDETLPTGESVRHTMWRLTDLALLRRIENLVASQKIVIADGHHRYETALSYAEAHPEIEGGDHIMIYLANIRGEGTVILPTHRVLYGVESFDQFKVLATIRKQFTVVLKDSLASALEFFNNESNAFTMIQFPEEPQWAVLIDQSTTSGSALERLAVSRLHEKILKEIIGLSQEHINAKTNLFYPHTVAEMEEIVQKHDYNAAFFLKPITADEMLAVTTEGSFMPQKSTFFYPKLLSGLVFHEFAAQSGFGADL